MYGLESGQLLTRKTYKEWHHRGSKSFFSVHQLYNWEDQIDLTTPEEDDGDGMVHVVLSSHSIPHHP